MNDFELRYNGVEQAYLFILQELVRTVATQQEGDPKTWIAEFGKRVSSKVDEAKNQDGSPREQRLVDLTKSVVKAVTDMAENKL